MVYIMAQGATPSFDSHGSFQTSGEVIAREDTVYHFLPFLYYFVHQYFITKQNKWKIFLPCFLIECMTHVCAHSVMDAVGMIFRQ
jgi:hypothetical protein